MIKSVTTHVSCCKNINGLLLLTFLELLLCVRPTPKTLKTFNFSFVLITSLVTWALQLSPCNVRGN